jgi:hypothetical protein
MFRKSVIFAQTMMFVAFVKERFCPYLKVSMPVWWHQQDVRMLPHSYKAIVKLLLTGLGTRPSNHHNAKEDERTLNKESIS